MTTPKVTLEPVGEGVARLSVNTEIEVLPETLADEGASLRRAIGELLNIVLELFEVLVTVECEAAREEASCPQTMH